MVDNSNTTQPQKQKQSRGRSRAYPVIPLVDALERITKLNSNLGTSKFNRDTIASGMGYSSLNGTSGRRIAALVQYGFLFRDNDKYYLSPLATKYLLPLEDSDMADAITEAALTPPLFSELYDVLRGQVLPKQFVNRLIQDFHIEQKVAPEVERIFRSTMETAGILLQNGTLKADIGQQQPPATKSNGQSGTIADNNPGSRNKADHLAPSLDYLSVELPSGLIVNFPRILASEVAFGTFGTELKTLDDAVTARKPTLNDTDEEV